MSHCSPECPCGHCKEYDCLISADADVDAMNEAAINAGKELELAVGVWGYLMFNAKNPSGPITKIAEDEARAAAKRMDEAVFNLKAAILHRDIMETFMGLMDDDEPVAIPVFDPATDCKGNFFECPAPCQFAEDCRADNEPEGGDEEVYEYVCDACGADEPCYLKEVNGPDLDSLPERCPWIADIESEWRRVAPPTIEDAIEALYDAICDACPGGDEDEVCLGMNVGGSCPFTAVD